MIDYQKMADEYGYADAETAKRQAMGMNRAFIEAIDEILLQKYILKDYEKEIKQSSETDFDDDKI